MSKGVILSNLIITMTGLVKLIDGLAGDGAAVENDGSCEISILQNLIGQLTQFCVKRSNSLKFNHYNDRIS